MDLPLKPPPATGWIRHLLARVLRWWPAKMTCTMAGMAVFFGAYFWLLRHPLDVTSLF